jgi:predicted RecB family endonuclease
MADGKGNGWDQYSKLVLKELDALGTAVTALREEVTSLRDVLSEMKANSMHTLTVVNELKQWKERIDDVASPMQLAELASEVESLKSFKTKAVTVFVVVQFGITLFIALSEYI